MIKKLDDGWYMFEPSDVDVMTTEEIEQYLKESGNWSEFLQTVKDIVENG